VAVSASARANAALRVFAATLGTLPIALFGAACIARFLPLCADVRYAIAFSVVIPVWVSAMCVTFLARSGARALACCGFVALALAALSLGVAH
jgi:hypothetical protein